MPPWNPSQWLLSPVFAPLHALIAQLPDKCFPAIDDLNDVLSGCSEPIVTAGGAPLTFAAPIDNPDYEWSIYTTGAIPTRPDNLHDLFNALVWLTFPQTKAAINALHVSYLQSGGSHPASGRRGTARDVLTLLDESGAIIACREPALAQLLREFRWKALFWEQRAALQNKLQCCVFGHNIYERAVTPYIGLTAKALIIPVTEEFFMQPRQAQNHYLDTQLAAGLNSGRWLDSTRHLYPFPLLGMPGWWPETHHAGFYDNTEYFRIARRQKKND
jgi:hypothetical protein